MAPIVDGFVMIEHSAELVGVARWFRGQIVAADCVVQVLIWVVAGVARGVLIGRSCWAKVACGVRKYLAFAVGGAAGTAEIQRLRLQGAIERRLKVTAAATAGLDLS